MKEVDNDLLHIQGKSDKNFLIDVNDYKELGEEINNMCYHLSAANKKLKSVAQKCKKIEDKYGVRFGYTELEI